MVSKNTLLDFRRRIDDMIYDLSKEPEGLDKEDLFKSLKILSKKIHYYAYNYDALNSHKKEGLGEGEK